MKPNHNGCLWIIIGIIILIALATCDPAHALGSSNGATATTAPEPTITTITVAAEPTTEEAETELVSVPQFKLPERNWERSRITDYEFKSFSKWSAETIITSTLQAIPATTAFEFTKAEKGMKRAYYSGRFIGKHQQLALDTQ